MLVDDEQLAKHPDLEFKLQLEALGVIGKRFMFRKYADTSMSWSELKNEVDSALRTLKRLQQLVPHATNEKRIVRELEDYERSVSSNQKRNTVLVSR